MQDVPLEDARILLMDEDEHQRQLLMWELTGLGFRNVTAVTSPMAALEHAADFPTDLIIADFHLGLLKLLRNHPRSPSPNLPVIMVSARANAAEVKAARDSGVDEFLVMPVEAEDLHEHIRNTLENRRGMVHGGAYNGPDRRRRRLGPPDDGERRGQPDTDG